MRRGPTAKVAARNAALLERARKRKAEHRLVAGTGLGPVPQPGRPRGYRRVWAYLRYVDGLVVKPEARLRSPGETQPEAAGQAQDRHQQAAADPAQRVVGRPCSTGTARRSWATMPACERAPGTGR